nr:MAG: hypothetical protein J07AB56_00380 [Candidatus Nanosalinarum sp. J07AB56]
MSWSCSREFSRFHRAEESSFRTESISSSMLYPSSSRFSAL